MHHGGRGPHTHFGARYSGVSQTLCKADYGVALPLSHPQNPRGIPTVIALATVGKQTRKLRDSTSMQPLSQTHRLGSLWQHTRASVPTVNLEEHLRTHLWTHRLDGRYCGVRIDQ